MSRFTPKALLIAAILMLTALVASAVPLESTQSSDAVVGIPTVIVGVHHSLDFVCVNNSTVVSPQSIIEAGHGEVAFSRFSHSFRVGNKDAISVDKLTFTYRKIHEHRQISMRRSSAEILSPEVQIRVAQFTIRNDC